MPENAPEKAEVTRLLKEWRAGRPEAVDHLFALVYGELKRVARVQLSRERRRQTLQPTELVNEAFLKLVDQKAAWQNRLHFYAIAAQAMRRILVDRARKKRAVKRPQETGALDVNQIEVGRSAAIDEILAIDEVLTRIAKDSPRQARVAELRIFCELELDDIAKVTGVSLATVKREWSEAKKALATVVKS